VGPSAAFYDDAQHRYVRSWFNRQRVYFDSGFINFGPSQGSTWSFTGASAYVVAFANEVIEGRVNGWYTNVGNAGQNENFGFAVDAGVVGQWSAITSLYQGVYYPIMGGGGQQASENEHNLGAYFQTTGTISGWVGINGTVG
jgi:hypothetical protein